jgi:2-polyprenyl-3-methyl-5-hydroxy-6-metoxy-1,4-benzoquinol methylase
MEEACDWGLIELEEAGQAERLAVWMRVEGARDVLDVGCGPGTYVRALRREGIEAYGIDNDPRIEGIEWCWYENAVIARPRRQYDWVICLEVGEHISADRADALVRYCVGSARSGIIFSAALPGQGGIGHINCQPKSYWIMKFAARGWEVDMPTTARLLTYMAAGYHMGWFLQNAFILRAYDR